MENMKLLDVIFHEGHIIDLDFSYWDRRVRLVIVADAMPPIDRCRRPIYGVDFISFSHFEWKSNHLEIPIIEGRHCQWTIMDKSIEKTAHGYRFTLWGPGPSPDIIIACQDFKITEINMRYIDQCKPGWDTKSGPLLRLGSDH